MKFKLVVLICAMTILTNVDVIGQNPYDNVEPTEYDIIVRSISSSPSIIDFVSSFLYGSEGESYMTLRDAWERYLKHQPAEKGATMFVDEKNGYVSYTTDYDLAYPEDPNGVISIEELCLWNCADGIHKIFAVNVVLTQNGELIQNEFIGISFYLYDKNTKRLTKMYNFINYDCDDPITFALPHKGKDIVETFHSLSGEIQKILVWDGYRFQYSMDQDPYDDVEPIEWDIIVRSKSSSPSIVDLVSSYLYGSYGELIGTLTDAWVRYLKHQPAEKGTTMFVDKENGYVSYTEDYDLLYPEGPSGGILIVELRLWNCADGIHKIFAENVVLTVKGKLVQTESTGTGFFLYNKNTKRLTMMNEDILDFEYDDSVTFELPRIGNDIVATIHTPSGKTQRTLVWDGYRFHLAK